MESEGMKPRSLFDNPDAWVVTEFKKPPRPATPIVALATSKPREEKVAPEPIPFPPAEGAVESYSSVKRDLPPTKKIIDLVSLLSKRPVYEIIGPARDAELATVRQIAMWLCRRFTGRSFPAIGAGFGRDHTTVIHAVRRIDGMIAKRGLEPPEDTREAWAKLLLAQYREDKERGARDYAKRQSSQKRERYHRAKAQGRTVRGPKTGQ
jgi:hypothetical protein